MRKSYTSKTVKKQKLRERLVEECEEIFQTPTFRDKMKSIHQRLLEAVTEKPEYNLNEIFQTPTFRDKKSIRQRLIEAGMISSIVTKVEITKVEIKNYFIID